MGVVAPKSTADARAAMSPGDANFGVTILGSRSDWVTSVPCLPRSGAGTAAGIPEVIWRGYGHIRSKQNRERVL